MITLNLSPEQVEAAIPFLGAGLKDWQDAVQAQLRVEDPRGWYVSVAMGPVLKGGELRVRARVVEQAYAGLIELRTRLLRRLRARESLVAAQAIEPLLRVLGKEMDAASRRQLPQLSEGGEVIADLPE